ncbi:uncharacterized protein B0H18DRAFT_1087947 [Fomitopsis serialis]|uniref:uncharacterized protein n=1 Tax=Fomitopsis serialis TaxID=139415 RepID=UPI002008BF7E|nr:uncharacterized protein B0H18DRAFT_1087947 [Neoantrodia serialis]KAH9913915.1 hypothetical protein B0H18DRAFT_1087947 [Neoantrodia serialis]
MFFSFAHVFTALSALSYVGLASPHPSRSARSATASAGTTRPRLPGTAPVPSPTLLPSNSTSGSNGTTTSSSGPHWVVYSDSWVSGENGPPDASVIGGYNVFICQEWASLDDTTRSTIKAAYKAAGVSLMVSAFGSTETPTSSGTDPTSAAQRWPRGSEDFDAFNDGSAIEWLETFTTALRSALPAGQYIITHARGSYLDIDAKVGSMIDWYNIAANNIDLNKLVIGKPASAADASNGYMDTATLASCVLQAQSKGWNAGVMTWEYPTADASWISAVRASAFPVN